MTGCRKRHCCERHNGMQIGTGQVLDRSSRKEPTLLVCQLTELRQTREWERYPNRFWHLCETLLLGNLGLRHCREWPAGKTESEIKLLLQENSKSQDLIVYTDGSVIKDQSGWGFSVKQGVTTIRGDSAAYTVSLNRQLENGGESSHPCPPLD